MWWNSLPDNMASNQVVYTCCTFAACVLFSPRPAFDGGQRNTPVIFVIAENPLQTEKMPLESPHGNFFTFSL